MLNDPNSNTDSSGMAAGLADTIYDLYMKYINQAPPPLPRPPLPPPLPPIAHPLKVRGDGDQKYDINGDGFITPSDYDKILKHLNNNDPPNKKMDVNNDGYVSPLDMINIIEEIKSRMPYSA